MAVSYPDVIGEYVATPERFVTGGLQYVGYFEPAQIAPEQVTYLYLFLQNVFNVPIKTNLKVNVPQAGGLFRGSKELLTVGETEIELELAAGEAGLLTLPTTTTEHTESGKHTLTIEAKASAQRGAQRVRPSESESKLGKGLIDSPVGLNLIGSLGATYAEKSVKKAPFELKVAGKPEPLKKAPEFKHNYEAIWTEEQAKYFNKSIQELNLRQVKLKNELNKETLYANLYGETTVKFADAGLPLRIGEAIIMAKILTYSCQYFLGNTGRRNGLLVPIWEQALAAQVDTSDSLDVIRTTGYHHLLKLSVAISFGLIAQAFGRHFWSLEERQGVANHIADSIEVGEPLDLEFLYLPLLMAGTQICKTFTLKSEDVNHTLALMKQAREARTNLFNDQDLAQANKVYNHILKKALK